MASDASAPSAKSISHTGGVALLSRTINNALNGAAVASTHKAVVNKRDLTAENFNKNLRQGCLIAMTAEPSRRMSSAFCY